MFFYQPQNIDIFSQLFSATLKEESQMGMQKIYKNRDIILKPITPITFFLYVLKGQVKIFKKNVNDKEIIVDILDVHHYFGEQFLFQKATNGLIIQAISDSEVFVLPLQLLKKKLITNHQLMIGFLQNSLCKQKYLNIEVARLSVQNTTKRTGCFILKWCYHNKGKKMQLPYRNNALASLLSMRAETFSRALVSLNKKCNIKINKKIIHIDNKNKAASYICQDCPERSACYVYLESIKKSGVFKQPV